MPVSCCFRRIQRGSFRSWDARFMRSRRGRRCAARQDDNCPLDPSQDSPQKASRSTRFGKHVEKISAGATVSRESERGGVQRPSHSRTTLHRTIWDLKSTQRGSFCRSRNLRYLAYDGRSREKHLESDHGRERRCVNYAGVQPTGPGFLVNVCVLFSSRLCQPCDALKSIRASSWALLVAAVFETLRFGRPRASTSYLGHAVWVDLRNLNITLHDIAPSTWPPPTSRATRSVHR